MPRLGDLKLSHICWTSYATGLPTSPVMSQPTWARASPARWPSRSSSASWVPSPQVAVRVGQADLVRLRAEGAAAAREGRALASPIDAYLSTAWVAWDHALGVAADGDAVVLGALGAALLRAGDDIAAALADGYTSAERALATSAGATREAILGELLDPASGDPASVARLVHRVGLVGFDPGSTYQLLLDPSRRWTRREWRRRGRDGRGAWAPARP